MPNNEPTREALAYRELSRAVNSCVFSNKNFIEEFKNDHRYLQGEVFKLALDIIKECAKDDYRFDGRNEFCHNIAKTIVENNKEIF